MGYEACHGQTLQNQEGRGSEYEMGNVIVHLLLLGMISRKGQIDKAEEREQGGKVVCWELEVCLSISLPNLLFSILVKGTTAPLAV